MRPMTTPRTISTDAHWDALPVGTLARVGYIEHDDDGREIPGGTLSILRVEGDVRANAGDCMLAGGKYWAEVWVWQQGVVAFDPTLLPEPHFEAPVLADQDAAAAVDAAIEDHARRVQELQSTPIADYWKLPREAHPNPTPGRDIIHALRTRGWAPASA